jgi:O-antigen/teichoic acid export membrane protein
VLRQFLSNSALYSAVGILARGVSFFLLPFYTRVLTPSDYGIIDLLLVFGNFVAVTVALEISQALARFLVDASTEEEKRRIASTALWFAVAAYTAFVLVAIPLCSWIALVLLGNAQLAGLIPYSLAAIWSGGINYILLLLLVYQLRAKANAISNLTVTVVTVAATISMVLFLRMGVRGVLAGTTAGNLVGAAVALVFARDSIRFVMDRKALGQMIRFSLPLIPSSVGTVASLQINRIMVLRLMSQADVGLLGVAYRVTSIVPLIMGGVQTALTPLVYNNYRRAEAPREIARIMRVFVFGSLAFFLVLSLFAKEILAFMTAPAYHGAFILVPALTLASMVPKMCDFAPGLILSKRTGTVAAISLTAAGLNVLLNLVAIPRWGTAGAAWVSCMSGVFAFAAYILGGQRFYRMPYEKGPLLGASAIALTFVFLGGMMRFPLALSIAVKTGMCVLAAVLFVQFGLVRLDEIRRGALFLTTTVSRVLGRSTAGLGNGSART